MPRSNQTAPDAMGETPQVSGAFGLGLAPGPVGRTTPSSPRSRRRPNEVGTLIPGVGQAVTCRDQPGLFNPRPGHREISKSLQVSDQVVQLALAQGSQGGDRLRTVGVGQRIAERLGPAVVKIGILVIDPTK